MAPMSTLLQNPRKVERQSCMSAAFGTFSPASAIMVDSSMKSMNNLSTFVAGVKRCDPKTERVLTTLAPNVPLPSWRDSSVSSHIDSDLARHKDDRSRMLKNFPESRHILDVPPTKSSITRSHKTDKAILRGMLINWIKDNPDPSLSQVATLARTTKLSETEIWRRIQLYKSSNEREEIKIVESAVREKEAKRRRKAKRKRKRRKQEDAEYMDSFPLSILEVQAPHKRRKTDCNGSSGSPPEEDRGWKEMSEGMELYFNGLHVVEPNQESW